MRTPIRATALGKIILAGEHAVVYGQPAIAMPVSQVQAVVVVKPAPPGSGTTLIASDIGVRIPLASASSDDPLAFAMRLALAHFGGPEPDATLMIRSTIPIASGLGSGAAVSTAIIRAVAGLFQRSISPEETSALVFEVEKLYHGTPSGIDNTVIAYEQPVYFVRGQPVARLRVGAPLTFLIADTGVASPTKEVVGQVRRAWEREKAHYDGLFDQIGKIVKEARSAIESGDTKGLGALMDENHRLLTALGVSSAILDRLVEAACLAGALGAKLSGAGRGGNMIALVEKERADQVAQALRDKGARQVIQTTVEARSS